MTRTANATYPQKLACLIWLAAESGHPFACAECGKPILPGQAIQFDHRQAVARGGANHFQALRPIHSAPRGTEDGQGNLLDCHYRKTCRPRSGATTLGGDNYEAKKTSRLANAQAAPPAATGRPWPSRPMQSRPMQSRAQPWPKRKMRGRGC